MSVSENEAAFVAELQQLTRKYKVAIAGCGCCQSPWLHPLGEDELTESHRYYYMDPMDDPDLVWRGPKEPPPPPQPEVIPDTPLPITAADTAKDRAVYDAWRTKQP